MKINLQKINFLKISLTISLIGIFLLLTLSNILEPKLINIEKINDRLINKKIKIQGEISNIKTYEDSNFQTISIRDNTGKIEVTIDKILNLKNNQTIILIGKVTQYKEYLQIKADKIINVS
jgi:DNA/RNA endonuclease YhcR with UshA esterase domain